MKSTLRAIGAVVLLAFGLIASASAQTGVKITEWMYSGGGGEFIEFTNVGPSAVDFTGWVYDDDSRFTTVAMGAFSLAGFGVVAPGESVIITEDTEATFRAAWSLLPASAQVLGGYTNNIGRADEINIYDGSGSLIDRLAYGDQTFPGTIRTQNSSGNPGTFAALGANNVSPWVLSSLADLFGSYASANNDLGNPGVFAPVPEAETYAMMLAGLVIVGLVSRRRRRGSAAQASAR